MNDTTRERGGVLGVAVLGTVMPATYRTHLLDATAGSGLPEPVRQTAASSAVAGAQVAHEVPEFARSALLTIVQDGFMNGLHIGCFILVGVTLIGAVVTRWLMPAQAKPISVIESRGNETNPMV